MQVESKWNGAARPRYSQTDEKEEGIAHLKHCNLQHDAHGRTSRSCRRLRDICSPPPPPSPTQLETKNTPNLIDNNFVRHQSTFSDTDRQTRAARTARRRGAGFAILDYDSRLPRRAGIAAQGLSPSLLAPRTEFQISPRGWVETCSQ